jgi:peptidoglycan/xylan/chitin deacetylase (PgdA/CDA1 family)
MSRRPGVLRRWYARIRHRALILLYHRVADAASDPYLLCVSPTHFEQQLRVIREIANPLPLGELAHHARNGRLAPRSVAITFDDGYCDNLDTAKPLLQQAGLPATFFVTSGDAGRTREFWWDELQRIVLESDALPPRLGIEVGGARIECELGESAIRPAAADGTAHAWNIEHEHAPTQRHALLRTLHARLLRMRPPAQTDVLDRLHDWARTSPVVRASHRALDAAEIAALADGGLCDVGAHTVSHPALPREPIEAQRDEIRRSRAALEQWIGRSVTGFAYPYGFYAAETVREARAAGFDYACACLGHPVRAGSDRFLLPRVQVPDVPGTSLRRMLEETFGG